MAGVLIAAEVTGHKIDALTAELVTAALKIEEAAHISVAVLSDDPWTAATGAAQFHTGKVYAVAHPSLKNSGTGGFDSPVTALSELCAQISPSTILFAKTDFGSNVGPRLAFRLGTSFAQDCVDLALDKKSGRVSVSRPVYGGNAMAVYSFINAGPQIISLRLGVFEPLSHSEKLAEVINFQVSDAVGEVKTRLLETISEERSGVRLEDAEVVVSGGRGLGGRRGFAELEKLAAVLNGALGGSRAACDAGWIDHRCQIGLTGKTIRPRVYITFGISGASQHMAGCAGAKSIVAVNKDSGANIFKDARFGVVGDWKKVYSGFMATVQDLMNR